jgi:hypothetical protein
MRAGAGWRCVRKNPAEVLYRKCNEFNARCYATRLFSLGEAMKLAAIYLQVSTQDQTTSSQEHELRQAADRAGWQVVKVYKDHGISGAKGRNGRPAFDPARKDPCVRGGGPPGRGVFSVSNFYPDPIPGNLI